MNRYGNTKKRIDKDGKIVYSTTYYPTIPIEDSDQFISSYPPRIPPSSLSKPPIKVTAFV